MTTFYGFDQLVYLRRDTSQYGRIGGAYDVESGKQLVFWEHPGADIVTSELVADLMGEVEYHERRVLFIHAMRQPEMKMVRMALWAMRDHGVDWRGIKECQIVQWGIVNDCWALLTDKWQAWTLLAGAANITPNWFQVMCVGGDRRTCTCEWCRDERRMGLVEGVSHE
jgi:hypothetical protein